MTTTTNIRNKINREKGIVTVITTVEHTDDDGNVTRQQTEEDMSLETWERQQRDNVLKTPPQRRKGSSSQQGKSQYSPPQMQHRSDRSPRLQHNKVSPRLQERRTLAHQHQPSTWPHTQTEFDIFTYINLVRTQPRLFLPLLYERRRYYRGKLYKIPGKAPIETEEGEAAIADAIEFLQKQPALKELNYSPGMSHAARDHVMDLGEKGLTGTQSTRFPHDTYKDRIDRYGQLVGLTVAEHISYGAEKAQTIVLDMLIDDGDYRRSHRDHLFSENWKNIGIGYGPHKRFGHICVIDFADAYVDDVDVMKNARKPLSFINTTNLKLQDLEDVHYEAVPSARIKQIISRGAAPKQGGAQLFQRGYDLGISMYSPYSVDLCSADSLVDIVFTVDRDVDVNQLHIVNNGRWFEAKEYFKEGKQVFHGRLTKLERGKLGVLYGNSFLVRWNVQ